MKKIFVKPEIRQIPMVSQQILADSMYFGFGGNTGSNGVTSADSKTNSGLDFD